MKKAAFLSIIFVLLVPILHAQNDSSIYPVSLSSFQGGVAGNNARLKWKTVCYLSFANFQIQKSLNGTTFSTINSFVADRLRCQQPFEFVDSSSYNSGNVFYRINVGDIDGNFYHSRMIKVLNRLTDFEVKVYPTVINSKANIVLSSPIDDNIRMRLISSGGIVVKQYYYKVSKGVSNFSLDFSDIAKGSYWITTVKTKGMQHAVAIIKQ